MTAFELTSAAFPAFERSVRAQWAPVLLEPIQGSYERLVVGVAVVGERSFHLELANAVDRLRCLYSADADAVIWAFQVATDNLRNQLASRGREALTDHHAVVSNVTIGSCREAEGESLEGIGECWMRALSSLYREKATVVDAAPAILPAMAGGAGADRLPDLVWNYVSERRSGLAPYFSRYIRDGKRRRKVGRSYEVLIDYAGTRLVANFGTLQAGAITKSVDNIKRRLWDLKVERDGEGSDLAYRAHEMIVQRPDQNDPQVTERQADNLAEALEALKAQADQEELRLRPLASVKEIGEHLLKAEAA